MRSLLRRRPSPAMVVATIALFVASGGVSYGLATGSIDSRELRNNSVRSIDIRNSEIRSRDVRDRSLLAKDFKSGELPAGPKGDKGDPGAKGEQGERGPSEVFSFRDTTTAELPSTSPPPAIGEVSLPAGSYAIVARVEIRGLSSNQNYFANCELRADDNTDRVSVSDVAPAVAFGAIPATLSLVHTFAAAGKAVLACGDSLSQPASRSNVQITAIRVDKAFAVVATP